MLLSRLAKTVGMGVQTNRFFSSSVSTQKPVYFVSRNQAECLFNEIKKNGEEAKINALDDDIFPKKFEKTLSLLNVKPTEKIYMGWGGYVVELGTESIEKLQSILKSNLFPLGNKATTKQMEQITDMQKDPSSVHKPGC